MATLFSIGTGNFTAAGTWGVINATMFNASETTTTALTTSFVGATTYTPGAITVSHIGVKLSVRTGTTGTISVRLAQGGVAVAGTTVTINVADLPVAANADLNGGWIFFKLSALVTLLAATAYSVQASTSSASQVSLRSTATSNWAIALVTTTTAAPAAGDNLIIGGEYISAGSSNSFTVTMDNTATTDFGSAPTAANSLLTPGIAIGSNGTLTWGTSAATAYYMRMSNSIIVYTGGTLNMGTSGTPCPRDSTMELFFDCGTHVNYGLVVRNLGTWGAYGQSRTSGKDIYYCKLNTDEAIASTSLGVDTDTGWLDNDLIAIASTTQTSAQRESGSLNGAASSTTLTVDSFLGAGGGLNFAHLGTNPVQAEIILLTRNVRIFGASAIHYYIRLEATSTVNVYWTAMYYIGSTTAQKEGVCIFTTTGTCIFRYCSIYNQHSSGSHAWYISTTTTGNIIYIEYCVTYHIQGYSVFTVTPSLSVLYIRYCVFIGNTQTSLASIYTQTPSALIDSCVVSSVSNAAAAIVITHSAIIRNCTIHSNENRGISISPVSATSILTGSIESCSIYRNLGSSTAGSGIGAASPIGNFRISDCIVFGNSNTNIGLSGRTSYIYIENTSLSSDSTFSTAYGIYVDDPTDFSYNMTVENCEFGATSSIYRPLTTSGIRISGRSEALLNNNKFSASTHIENGGITSPSYLISHQHNREVNNHFTIKPQGRIELASSSVHSGSFSMRLIPSASRELESSGLYGGFKVPVASGQSCTPTVYVYEDSPYNGSRARLYVKKNYSMGITSDTLLDTATAASDLAWEALTGTTSAATSNGTMEFVVVANSSTGSVYIDTFSATVA